MDIQAEKSILIEQLKLVNDASLIQAIKGMLEFGLKNQEGRISLDQYNEEIEAAEREIENGNGISHENLKKEARKW